MGLHCGGGGGAALCRGWGCIVEEEGGCIVQGVELHFGVRMWMLFIPHIVMWVP